MKVSKRGKTWHLVVLGKIDALRDLRRNLTITAQQLYGVKWGKPSPQDIEFCEWLEREVSDLIIRAWNYFPAKEAE